MTVFPLSKQVSDTIGGYLGLMAHPADSYIWNLKSVEEAYQLFEFSFPQFRVRECITEQNMKGFLSIALIRFENIRGRKSLTVTVGERRTQQVGGIVFFGDAANSLPPNVAQGVTSAFEDVGELMIVIDELKDNSLEDLLKHHQLRRESGVEGLMRIVRFANTYQYEQNKLRTRLGRFNRLARKKLSKTIPHIVQPAMADLLKERISYNESARLADGTTATSKVTVISIILMPVVAFFLSIVQCAD